MCVRWQRKSLRRNKSASWKMLNIQDLSDQKRGVKLVMKHLIFFTFLILNFKISTKQTRMTSKEKSRHKPKFNKYSHLFCALRDSLQFPDSLLLFLLVVFCFESVHSYAPRQREP